MLFDALNQLDVAYDRCTFTRHYHYIHIAEGLAIVAKTLADESPDPVTRGSLANTLP
ncbi:MAG: hypothetical protein V3R53_00560 [Gammaproteobacteria bacterium]